jgi:hypothetical protein
MLNLGPTVVRSEVTAVRIAAQIQRSEPITAVPARGRRKSTLRRTTPDKNIGALRPVEGIAGGRTANVLCCRTMYVEQ